MTALCLAKPGYPLITYHLAVDEHDGAPLVNQGAPTQPLKGGRSA
ncbi:hypothetical protein [Lamprobacter modestohalophilus]|nr:hypothetical protein [Lamprobacter modestohalophilus]